MSELVLASGNKGKLAELQVALQPLGHSLRPISDWTTESPEENGGSFVANALIKARHAAAISGLPSLADDSGLEVYALNGAPGIYSARYAGVSASDTDNNAKLLQALAQTPETQRTARFRCVIALVHSAEDPKPLICEGSWEGRILQTAQGEQGFGYDPLFAVPELNCSAAELDKATKLKYSHRGKAIRALIQQLS